MRPSARADPVGGFSSVCAEPFDGRGPGREGGAGGVGPDPPPGGGGPPLPGIEVDDESPRVIDENPPTEDAMPSEETTARPGRRSRPSAAMIASAPSSSRNKTNGAKQATSKTASASNNAPVAAANDDEWPRPESIADPVVNASATTIFEQIEREAAL